MNVIEMTHEEIHEQGIEALISALGLAGTIQFLERYEPGINNCTAERRKWLNKLDKEATLKEIQRIRQACKPKSEYGMLDVSRDTRDESAQRYRKNIKTEYLEPIEDQIGERGIETLVCKFGVAGTFRFLQHYNPGKGNYTVDRHKLPEPDMETIMEGIQAMRAAKQVQEQE